MTSPTRPNPKEGNASPGSPKRKAATDVADDDIPATEDQRQQSPSISGSRTPLPGSPRKRRKTPPATPTALEPLEHGDHPGGEDMEAGVTQSPSRRNPKRKAAEVASEVASDNSFESPSEVASDDNASQKVDIVKEALAPLTKEEIREWPGWVEVESDPAFFSVLLSEFGVKHVQVQDVFSIADEDLIDMIPKPVYGLIFLYQYFHEGYDEAQDTEPEDVWFANQTTDNACATLAMMNIVMNRPELKLGRELRAFKQATKDLPSALRGYALDNNEHLRSVHNSFTRRVDQLVADDYVENRAAVNQKKVAAAKKRNASSSANSAAGTASGTKGTRTNKTTAPQRGRTRKLKQRENGTNHFIAYVPINGVLWELDGYKPGPVNLGPIPDGESFIAATRPFIEARIDNFEHDAHNFSMMALCGSPLADASKDVAKTIRHFDLLRSRAQGNEDFAARTSENTQPLTADNEEKLHSDAGLTRSEVDQTEADPSFQAKMDDDEQAMETTDLVSIYDELVIEQRQALAAYRDALGAVRLEQQRVMGRRQDNMAAIHRWLELLAEKGVLEEMLADNPAQN